MNKKIYNTPYVEQTECVMMKFAICSNPDNPEQQPGTEAPGMGDAPTRRVF